MIDPYNVTNPLAKLPVFNQSRSGRLFGPVQTELELGVSPDNLSFKLPCWFTIESARKITVYDVPGLPDTVKMDMGFNGLKINVSSHVGDYDIRVIYQLQGQYPLVALNTIHDIVVYFRNISGPVWAVDKEGILSKIGVTHIVITDIHLDPQPERPGVYNVSLSCLSELSPTMSAIELLTELQHERTSVHRT